jgi:hypothetical protein
VISPRYAAAVSAMLVLALVPTVIHVYAGAVVNDGRRATNVPQVLAGLPSEPSARAENWGRRRFESDDWQEREYSVTGREPVVLTVVRSFDLKALYHHPELAIAYGGDFEAASVQTFDSNPDVPVFVLPRRTAEGPPAFYVLHYDGEFVSRPILFQIRTAGELLFRGRRAMTLFFAQQSAPDSKVELSRQPAFTVLMAAVRAFTASTTAGP